MPASEQASACELAHGSYLTIFQSFSNFPLFTLVISSWPSRLFLAFLFLLWLFLRGLPDFFLLSSFYSGHFLVAFQTFSYFPLFTLIYIIETSRFFSFLDFCSGFTFSSTQTFSIFTFFALNISLWPPRLLHT